jgi:hypothetical protein
MTIEGFRVLTKAAGVQSVVQAITNASLKAIEDQLPGADDAKQAQVIEQWSGAWRQAHATDEGPDPQAWVNLIDRFYNPAKGALTVSALGGPDVDPKAPSQGINPLELGLGIGACLLAATGPAGVAAVAVMSVLGQIFGAGGSEIDWDWVLTRIRSIVREELQEIQVQTLGGRVKTLGDWVVNSLDKHPEWGPDDGSQFQERLGQAQLLAGELMYTQSSSRATQAGALGFFLVAANLHLALLTTAALRARDAGRTTVALAYLDELVSYVETRYVPHARRVTYWLIAKRIEAISPGPGGLVPFVAVDFVGVNAGRSDVGYNLYVRLIRQFMTAAMSSALETVRSWSTLVGKARLGQIVAGVSASAAGPAPAPDSSPPVKLYQHVNYGGVSQTLEVGRHDYAVIRAGIGNDTLTSLRVREGYRAILYADAGFRGAVRDCTADTSKLINFNDTVSSVIVERLW